MSWLPPPMSWLKKVSWREILTYLAFVVLATILWYGHAMTSVRNAIVTVPVLYTGIPDKIAFTTPLPESLQIEVRDAGGRLVVYRQDPPKLIIDLSNQFTSRKGEVRISEETLRSSITSLLQGTSKLQQVIPDDIQIPYYTQHTKVVPVLLQGSYTADVEYQQLGDPCLQPVKVHLYGMAKQLDTIQAVYTESVTVTGMRDTFTTRLALMSIEGVRYETDSVDLQINHERVTEKVLTVPIHVRHQPHDTHLRLFPREVNVTLRVSMAHFADITINDIIAECRFPKTTDHDIPIQIRYSSPYIHSARVSPTHVEFIIEKDEENTNGGSADTISADQARD